jgi:hypothetical protein
VATAPLLHPLDPGKRLSGSFLCRFAGRSRTVLARACISAKNVGCFSGPETRARRSRSVAERRREAEVFTLAENTRGVA